MAKRIRKSLDKRQLTEMYHRMMQALQEAQFYKRAIDQSSAIAFLDCSGKITDINDKYSAYFKVQADDVIGTPYFLFTPGYLGELHQRQFDKALASRQTWRGEQFLKLSDHELWLEISVIPLADPEGKILQYMVIQTDITEKKQAEHNLQQERLKSFHAAKMASLGEMAGGVAHEINNPLAIILGKTDQIKRMVQMDQLDAQRLVENIEKIESTAIRISKIVKGLRTLSRGGDHDPFAPASFHALLADVLIISKERFTHNEIDLRIKKTVNVLLECRGVQIAQVLLNLISNAFDAVQRYEDKWVEIDSQDLGDSIEISISDSGKGIPNEIAQKIMEPFYTTKEVGKGTGLGLSISKSIIESHGGTLTYDSASPHTRFVVHLPKRQSANAA